MQFHLIVVSIFLKTCVKDALSYDPYFVLDNQKSSKDTFHATKFKVEENSRTFQGLHLKFKDF